MLPLFLLAGALTTRGASAAELVVVQVAPQKSPSAVVCATERPHPTDKPCHFGLIDCRPASQNAGHPVPAVSADHGEHPTTPKKETT